MFNIPCYVTTVCCRQPCGKFLPCRIHTCQRSCHSGSCQSFDQKCIQKCTIQRRKCGHSCNLSCHGDDPCPITTCQTIIKLRCPCDSLEKDGICNIKSNEFNEEKNNICDVKTSPFIEEDYDFNLTSRIEALKIQIENSLLTRKQQQQQQLECNDECRVIQENKSFTQAFSMNIDEPRQLPNIYTDFLIDYAKNNFEFVQICQVTRRLLQFYTFPPMEFNERHLLRELASFYDGIIHMLHDAHAATFRFGSGSIACV
ncbi:unnamed protein product [Rotaria sordida]|uniref:NF-X1-type domain-containing protein n=1 Tax=Rotaria sordida TaxID=392033 RepID=A0A815P047_9BILA|nr:unnamed protein product [Rotaria sordida]